MAYKPAPWNWNTGLLSKVAGRDVTKPKPLKPWTPQLLPGMYDPNIDFQRESEGQGYGFTQQDYATGNARRHEGLYGASGSFDGQDYSTLGALGLIDRNRTRGQENYTTDTANLQRGYHNLETRQGGLARAMGVSQGGTQAAAGLARAGNERRDQDVLDTNWRRFQEDNTQQRGQALYGASTGQEDDDTSMGRATAAHQLFAGDSDATHLDPASQLGRAATYGAAQAGTLPSTPPPGQFVDPNSPIGKALGVPSTAGQVPGFVSQGVPAGTPVINGPNGPYFQQPAAGGGVWHIYADGRRVKVK